MHLERQFNYQLLKPGILSFDFLYLCPGSVPGNISGKPIFAGLHEILEPDIIGTGANAFPATEIPDWSVPPEAL